MPRILVFLILALPLVGAYALYSVGIVAIFQASRVLNLAHGAMATVPAFLFYSLVRGGVPMPVALALGLAAGALLGIGIERIFVRRLRSVSNTAQTVGTVAAFGVLISLTAKIWGTGGLTAPGIFPEGHFNVGSSILRYGQLGLFGVAVVVTVLLYVLLTRTWFGLAMRGAAVNRRAAALCGVDPDRTTAAAWALGGSLAALAGILLASVTTLHPYTLSLSVLPAFVAALIAGLESMPGALAGAGIVGVVIGFVPVLAGLPGLRLVIGQLGGAELTLATTAMVVMAARGRRLSSSEVQGDGSTTTLSAPSRVRLDPGLARILGVAAAAVAIGWVFLPGVQFSILGDVNQALIYALVAVSLVLLVGWVGQISLAQAAFVGVGAYSTTFVVRHLDVPFPFTIPIAVGVAAGVAALLGMVALRVRGLYLAVATLIFAWMADYYLFSAPWLVGSGGSISIRITPIGPKDGFPYFDFTDRRTFYFLALASVALAVAAVANLRRSKTGRAFFAIRGSEIAAASLGIDVTRYKLLAFALSGGIAGLAGTLIATHAQTIVPAQFAFTFSLFYLSVAVVGGLRSLGGALGASVVFAALNQVFFRYDVLRGWLDVVSALLLAVVLVFYPGGLADAPAGMRRLRAQLGAFAHRAMGPRRAGWLFRELRGLRGELTRVATDWRGFLVLLRRRAPLAYAGVRAVGNEARELRAEVRGVASRFRRYLTRAPRHEVVLPTIEGGAEPAFDALHAQAILRPSFDAPREQRGIVVEAAGVTVQFGGLVALEDASLKVHEGEIVGLVGPNGAGKTTLFNSIAGFNAPAAGTVTLRGEDVSALPVHERARRGIGRTFQVIQLFTDLSVRENLLVATHTRNDSRLLSHLTVGRASLAAEDAAAARVERAAALLGLDGELDRPVGGLPFGTLRLVEVARALVTGAPLIMLDEPASGLDTEETERLAQLLRSVRDRAGVSLLLIEHDVHMVMSHCDYVYVLDRGRLIAHGTPEHVRRDPAVVAAYLGTAAGAASA